MRGTLFLNSSEKSDWLPAPIYVPSDAGDPYAEFVRQWSHHIEASLAGDSPAEVVNELVRRHGLVIVSEINSVLTVTSRRKQLQLSSENLSEIEDTFNDVGDVQDGFEVHWKPSLAAHPVRTLSSVVFHGAYDYVADRPDRVDANREKEREKEREFVKRGGRGSGGSVHPGSKITIVR